ncbi:glycosyltransferase family 4 protein [Dyadobacter flavalbus]|uniref:Glycosyltransferase family 4 protein n=1 Tax=Dyadobacter flavalbus TaxID=2579942 RepID=A0A5M8QUS4_9BACT|nr:glycosyltransferase family 4 protein [Dyadobacter flavalbus]KAA6438386.1 glycosyltransferase family 4 protein [Dyadobacter flavalbus]
MEILFVSHKFPPSVGGMEKQSFELVNGMKQFATVHSIVYSGQESRAVFFFSLERRILETLRKFPSISVIHFNDALIASFCLRHKSYNHLFRAVTVHGLDVVFPSAIYQKFILPAFNRFDLIIAVSQACASACIARGIAPEKVAVIPNGADHSLLNTKQNENFHETFRQEYGIDLDGKTILTALGRPVKRKGFSWFIQHVLPQLKGNFVFLLIGPFEKTRSWSDRLFYCLPEIVRSKVELFLGYPSDENRIRNLLHRKTDSKVFHLGKLSHEGLHQVLAATDAFVMPNIRVAGDMEGFGLVCLEASLCGAWVFASRIDGIPDAVHHSKNGTLINPGNAPDWAAALNAFISDPAGFNSQSQTARTYTAENFGWTKMVECYLKFFQDLNSGQKG